MWRSILVLAIGCTRAATPLANQTAAPEPPTITIAEATVFRDTPGQARLDNVFGFTSPPVIGAAVTVLPLNLGPPIELSIKSTKRRDDVPSEIWWEVELEPTRDRAFVAAPPTLNKPSVYPFDAIVLYPVQRSARLVQPSLVGSIPEGVFRATIYAAIDLDGNGTVEALRTRYCCHAPAKPGHDCDLVCDGKYRRAPTDRDWPSS